MQLPNLAFIKDKYLSIIQFILVFLSFFVISTIVEGHLKRITTLENQVKVLTDITENDNPTAKFEDHVYNTLDVISANMIEMYISLTGLEARCHGKNKKN